MKKTIFLAAVAAALLTGCADSRIFRRADGTEFTAQPYGWMTKDHKIEGVEYELSAGNIVLSCIFGETVVVPVLLTGLELWEPVSYNEPGKEIKPEE